MIRKFKPKRKMESKGEKRIVHKLAAMNLFFTSAKSLCHVAHDLQNGC